MGKENRFMKLSKALVVLFFFIALVSGSEMKTKVAGAPRKPARDLRADRQGSGPPVPLFPAQGLHAQLDARGVYLIWDSDIVSRPASMQFDYRIYRREKGSATKTAVPFQRGVIHTREGERWTGVDMTIQWEKTYSYWVTPLTRSYTEGGRLISEVEGKDSGPLEITTHNVFPPGVPERLLVMVSPIPDQRFVDLLWAPNTEKDISGYNVYRREQGGQVERVNSAPVQMMSFQDINVASAHIYFYCISAVDVRGNESARSQEVQAVLR